MHVSLGRQLRRKHARPHHGRDPRCPRAAHPGGDAPGRDASALLPLPLGMEHRNDRDDGFLCALSRDPPRASGGWRGVGRSDAQDGAQHAHQVRRHLEAPESHEGARPPKAQRSCVGLRPCAGATCPRICKQIPVWQEMRTAQAETSGVRDRRIATETRVAYAPPSRVHPGLAARHSTPTPTAGGGMRGCVLRTVYISAVVRRPEQTQHI